MARDPVESKVQREYREDIVGSGDVPNARKTRKSAKQKSDEARFFAAIERTVKRIQSETIDQDEYMNLSRPDDG